MASFLVFFGIIILLQQSALIVHRNASRPNPSRWVMRLETLRQWLADQGD